MTGPSPYRLPTHVRPLRYSLKLAPDLDSFTFTGQVSIQVQVTEPTSQVVLNAAELRLTHAQAHDRNGSTLQAKEITVDEKAETATITFGRELPAGSATLEIRFSGVLNDQLRGFYRCKYTTPRR